MLSARKALTAPIKVVWALFWVTACHSVAGLDQLELYDDSGSVDCDKQLEARASALGARTDGLIAMTEQLKSDVGFACSSIAQDLGDMNAPMIDQGATDVADTELEAACTAATAAINARREGGATIEVDFAGGKCEVDADGQLSCEASCDGADSCDLGSVATRCDPSELSGTCSGECTGSCETTESVPCEGQCSGTCYGACAGTCAVMGGGGICEGKCSGSCSGECVDGICELVAPGAVCGGTCTGECSLEFVAPNCTGGLSPPSCDINLDCQAGCDGQAKFAAECTPPTVAVSVTDMVGDGVLGATLEAHLPLLLLVTEIQGALVTGPAGELATRLGDTAAGVRASSGCIQKIGASFLATATAGDEAFTSLNIAVSASAEVTSAAMGGT